MKKTFRIMADSSLSEVDAYASTHSRKTRKRDSRLHDI